MSKQWSSELERTNQEFQQTFQGITWFTYREAIEKPLVGTQITSDAGWGCMLRTGQMILCQAIKRHLIGGSFKIGDVKNVDTRNKYFDILRMFLDNLTDHSASSSKSPATPPLSPFGIHSICQEGKRNLNLTPGQWYGPQMISVVLRNLCDKYKPVPNFSMHVCLDGNVFFDEIEAKFEDASSAVFVLVPIRLGIDEIQPKYLEQVKYIFSIRQNVGIAGGKDHMALYFVGDEDTCRMESGIFYLDPHYVNPAIPSSVINRPPPKVFDLLPYMEQFHCSNLRMLSPRAMCTSLAPGFYLKNKAEFIKWKEEIKRLNHEYKDQAIFSIFDQKPKWMAALNIDEDDFSASSS